MKNSYSDVFKAFWQSEVPVYFNLVFNSMFCYANFKIFVERNCHITKLIIYQFTRIGYPFLS